MRTSSHTARATKREKPNFVRTVGICGRGVSKLACALEITIASGQPPLLGCARAMVVRDQARENQNSDRKQDQKWEQRSCFDDQFSAQHTKNYGDRSAGVVDETG